MNESVYKEDKKSYAELLEENAQLKCRIRELEHCLGKADTSEKSRYVEASTHLFESQDYLDDSVRNRASQTRAEPIHLIDHQSDKNSKIDLFMSLFRGRSDVYAKRWNSKKGKSGYSPCCCNEWKPGVCFKPKVKCSSCDQRSYSELTQEVIELHLRGSLVVGIYPLLPDETCFFLAMDFDKEGWGENISAVRETCFELNIPVAVERSQSGNGGHVWFFFDTAISASIARRFGMALLTKAMEKRHELSFRSYDRLFPNQDTMPKGGFGNLIALPLQKSARENGNTVFVDEKFQACEDQWAFLSSVERLAEADVISLINEISNGNELGQLKTDPSGDQSPWEKKTIVVNRKDFPGAVEIARAGMLYIKTNGFKQTVLNRLKRFAAFKNPEFYKKQAMRYSTYGFPPVISCSDDIDGYLVLPRGCEVDVTSYLSEYGVGISWIDQYYEGRSIRVEFNGVLRPEQESAVKAVTAYNNGVLCASTAFGKTVVGAAMIAAVKVNTLVLVHRRQLMVQWQERLSQFLVIHEKLQELPKKRGRKRTSYLIGQYGGGKDQRSSIVDIAVMQSLINKDDIKEWVNDYGMIIVDECHHGSAVSFEKILRSSKARYMYGLTATPARRDGHHPIIFFHCGPIRFKVDDKQQAEERPFDHYLVPRFTQFREGYDDDGNALTIQAIYSRLMEDDIRNQMIVDDIVECYKSGRNGLVVTGRVAHAQTLEKELLKLIPDVILLTGGMGSKKTKERLEMLGAISSKNSFVIVSTGSFIGEGFDEPRLDTLFLAMPVSWRGTLQQYAGRLHRLHKGKRDVQIFDYADVHVKMLDSMYGKRLKGYASIGYKARVDTVAGSSVDFIFNKNNFFPVYLSDITNSREGILIVSPFLTIKRVQQMMEYFKEKLNDNVNITILTRPADEFNEKKRFDINRVFTLLRNNGVRLILKPQIHQKFAVIDHKIVWFGSINLLSFGYSEESIIRLISRSISAELSRGIAPDYNQ
ncbi:MAG: DEAD/DEAH box helicase family protein [Desulfotignum sp.]|nr:DEAD/DEAH box helicase family protein [Desulfotignum sp.]